MIPKILAAYYNNLGQAEARTGQLDEAVKSYDLAAQQNPAGAAQYYYNQGAVLTNVGKVDAANAAFDKSIAADPTKADAYYQKGVNLINKATTDPKTGKVIPAPGTEEALNKYLELQPTGQFADGAKEHADVHRKQHRDQLRQVKESRANKEVAVDFNSERGQPQGCPFLM